MGMMKITNTVLEESAILPKIIDLKDLESTPSLGLDRDLDIPMTRTCSNR